MRVLRKPILDAHIMLLQEKVQKLEQEIDEIVIEKIHSVPQFARLGAIIQNSRPNIQLNIFVARSGVTPARVKTLK